MKPEFLGTLRPGDRVEVCGDRFMESYYGTIIGIKGDDFSLKWRIKREEDDEVWNVHPDWVCEAK